MSKSWRSLINPKPGYLVIAADGHGRILTDYSKSAEYLTFLQRQAHRYRDPGRPGIYTTTTTNDTKETQTHDTGIDDNRPHSG